MQISLNRALLRSNWRPQWLACSLFSLSSFSLRAASAAPCWAAITRARVSCAMSTVNAPSFRWPRMPTVAAGAGTARSAKRQFPPSGTSPPTARRSSPAATLQSRPVNGGCRNTATSSRTRQRPQPRPPFLHGLRGLVFYSSAALPALISEISFVILAWRA